MKSIERHWVWWAEVATFLGISVFTLTPFSPVGAAVRWDPKEAQLKEKLVAAAIETPKTVLEPTTKTVVIDYIIDGETKYLPRLPGFYINKDYPDEHAAGRVILDARSDGFTMVDAWGGDTEKRLRIVVGTLVTTTPCFLVTGGNWENRLNVDPLAEAAKILSGKCGTGGLLQDQYWDTRAAQVELDALVYHRFQQALREAGNWLPPTNRIELGPPAERCVVEREFLPDGTQRIRKVSVRDPYRAEEFVEVFFGWLMAPENRSPRVTWEFEFAKTDDLLPTTTTATAKATFRKTQRIVLVRRDPSKEPMVAEIRRALPDYAPGTFVAFIQRLFKGPKCENVLQRVAARPPLARMLGLCPVKEDLEHPVVEP